MKGEKDMKSIKHYDDFTDVLNRMNNDDFALFLTGYAESIGRNIQLLPIHIDKFDCLAWVGYFTENGGLNGDDENRFIVSEILKNAYCSDYVLIEEGEERPKLTFFTKKNLKSEMFKHLFVVKLFTDKKAWSEPLYENGSINDTYTAFCEYLTTEEISDNNEKKYREMIDKYYIIKFTSTMVNSKECIYVVHLTDIDMLQRKFTCRSLTKYGMNYEFKENDTIDFCDLINDSLRNVTEISRIKFHEILDAYRDLQILF